MNICPAIIYIWALKKGWTYYSIKMKMKDVGKEIGFADDLENSKSLIQLQRARGKELKQILVISLLNVRIGFSHQ